LDEISEGPLATGRDHGIRPLLGWWQSIRFMQFERPAKSSYMVPNPPETVSKPINKPLKAN